MCQVPFQSGLWFLSFREQSACLRALAVIGYVIINRLYQVFLFEKNCPNKTNFLRNIFNLNKYHTSFRV